MTGFLATLGLPEVVAGLLFVALNAYVLMGGADLGSGVWDLLATGPRRAQQRELIARAISPIWEANHVWLVIAVVICFTAFPPAFATVTTILHIPLTLMLIGIVLRGSAFVFRSYGPRKGPATIRWGRTFAIASIATPVLFGIVIGAIATGAVATAQALVGTESMVAVFVAPWLAPFPVTVGLLALALFAQLAATYLTLVTDDAALRNDFRRRALASGAVAFAFATLAAALAHAEPSFANAGLLSGPKSVFWLAATGLFAATAMWALWRRRFALGRVAVGAQVSLILWGWASGQYPYLVPTAITIREAAAPHATLEVLLWALAGGAVLLIPSLRYLLRTFAAHPEHPLSRGRRPAA
jgi:cytochrome bd ubiquinol oxidase subunit II